MPHVYNIRSALCPPHAVRIDRSTKWGNPFIIRRGKSRKFVIDEYRDYLHTSGLAEQIKELRGKDLACWCKPLPCHGDVLLELANR